MTTKDGLESDLGSGNNQEYPVWVNGGIIWLELECMTLFQRRLARSRLQDDTNNEGNKTHE
jgi:hypothetical protein